MKLRYFIWLLSLLLCCNKKSQSPPVVKQVPFTYSTICDSVITANPNSSVLFVFSVKVLGGSIDTSPVTYFITGLPDSVSATPASIVVARLLGGYFTFSVGNIALGTYPLKLIAANKVNDTQVHAFTLKVVAPPDFAPLLAGVYDSCYDYCMPADSFDHYITTVSTVADTPYKIKITNLKNLGIGFAVSGWVSSTVRIPIQTIGGYTIWGSGTYTKVGQYQVTINDTLVHGSDTERCIVHIQHD